MNPNDKELYELVKENNRILKGIRSSNRWSAFFRIFYWIIIIGISVGAFIYIQPYVDSVFKAYQSIQNDINAVKQIGNIIPKK